MPTGDVLDFMERVVERYGGYTASNPLAAPPYRGVWKSRRHIEVDQLYSVMVLVPARQQDQALRDFRRWKSQLEH